MKFSILSIILIFLNLYITFSQDTDEKYYFKGDFGTSTLTSSKVNLIKGTSDVLITRTEGSYKFYYNITLTGINGDNIFQTKIMGPSAPNKDDGQLKLTLSYSDDSTSTLVSFKGTGSQTLSFNSPAANLVASTLTGLASGVNDKSNYANEQFYVVVITKTDGTSPVSRAQLLYTGSSNLPIEGGGQNPNGSTDSTTPTSTPSTTTATPTPTSSSSTTPISDSGSKTSDTPSSTTTPTTTATTTATTTNGNLNPGGVESSTTSSSKTEDSSHATTSILPTLLISSLFVLTLVIMS